MANSNDNLRASNLLRLDAQDNVAVATAPCDVGQELPFGDSTLPPKAVRLLNRIAVGHKVAIRDIAAGEKVIKSGYPIGSATCLIRAGEHVHTHNLQSDYIPTFTLEADRKFIKD